MTKDIDYVKDIILYSSPALIYIVTEEEERVFEAITEALKSEIEEKKIRLYEWSIVKGLKPSPTTEEYSTIYSVFDYIKTLERSIDIFVFYGIHAFFNPAAPDYQVIRNIFEYRFNCWAMIFISPLKYIPPELKRYMHVIDWSLPDIDEIKCLINKTVQSFNDIKKDKEKINLEDDFMNKLSSMSRGLVYDELVDIYSLSLNKYNKFNLDLIKQAKKQLILKSGFLEYCDDVEKMSEVGGLKNLKIWLNKRKNAFTEKAKQFGLPTPRGIMLIGIPGVGKSLVCKALSSLLELPLIRLDIGKLFSRLVGSSEENVRNVLKTVEAVAPCVLFIDEIEKGLSGVVSSNLSDAGTTARVVSTILSWLNDKVAPVFVAATANNISQLPPELLRKGRFDEIFFIDLPNKEERKEIFKIHLEKRNRNPDKFGLNLDVLSEMTENYSGAEIEQVVISALYDAFNIDADITQAGLVKAVEDIVPLYRTAKEELDWLRQWVNINENGVGTRARIAN